MKRKILVAPKSLSTKSLQQLRLPHPRTGEVCSYYADPQSKVLLEAAAINMEGKRSFLGNDWCLSDGSVSILTPIDPLYLYLSLVTQVSRSGDDEWKFVDIESIQLESHGHMDATSLSMLFGMIEARERALSALCEVRKVTDSMRVVRIDNDKVVGWLKRKCDPERLPKALERAISVHSIDKELLQQAKTREMALLVSEYLSPYWSEKLFAEFGGFASVSENENKLSKAVQAVVFDDPESYAQRIAPPQILKDAKPAKPKTAKEKQMEKAAKKAKPITSFFKRKD